MRYLQQNCPDTIEYVNLITSLSLIYTYHPQAVTWVFQFIYKAYSREEFIQSINAFCRMVTRNWLIPPHIFLCLLTRCLITSIPNVADIATDISNPQNKDLSNTILQVYRNFLGAFFRAAGRRTPRQFFRHTTYLRDPAERELLSFVMHRVAVLDAFSPSISSLQASLLVEAYFRLMHAIRLPVKKPFAIALAYANIVRPLQGEKGLTRSRAAWALYNIVRIEGDGELAGKMDALMQKWQEEVKEDQRLSFGRLRYRPSRGYPRSGELEEHGQDIFSRR
jgi:hypothetical protein